MIHKSIYLRWTLHETSETAPPAVLSISISTGPFRKLWSDRPTNQSTWQTDKPGHRDFSLPNFQQAINWSSLIQDYSPKIKSLLHDVIYLQCICNNTVQISCVFVIVCFCNQPVSIIELSFLLFLMMMPLFIVECITRKFPGYCSQ